MRTSSSRGVRNLVQDDSFGRKLHASVGHWRNAATPKRSQFMTSSARRHKNRGAPPLWKVGSDRMEAASTMLNLRLGHLRVPAYPCCSRALRLTPERTACVMAAAIAAPHRILGADE